MPNRTERRTILVSWLLAAMGVGILITSAGCGLMATLIHAGTGNMVPAEYDELKGKRVAVVCVSNGIGYGPTEATTQLSRRIGQVLAQSVKDVEIVSNQEIDDWIDRNDWDQIDFVSLGKGVKADAVIGVALNSFTLYEGKTLYRGKADVEVLVYDLLQEGKQEGKVVFERHPPQVLFPVASGTYTADMAEEAFRRKFMEFLAQRVARYFVTYDAATVYAQDTVLIEP